MAGLYACNWRSGLPTGRDLDAMVSALVYDVPTACPALTDSTHPEYATVISMPSSFREGLFLLYPHSSDHWRLKDLLDRMHQRGYWARLRTPFIPDDLYACEFTQHGATGWNGIGDYYAQAPTMLQAACLAAVMTVPEGLAWLTAVPHPDDVERSISHG